MELNCVYIPGQIISVHHFTSAVRVLLILLLDLIFPCYLFSVCAHARLVIGCSSLLLLLLLLILLLLLPLLLCCLCNWLYRSTASTLVTKN